MAGKNTNLTRLFAVSGMILSVTFLSLTSACSNSENTNTQQSSANQPSSASTPAPTPEPTELLQITAQKLADEVSKEGALPMNEKYENLTQKGVRLQVTGKVLDVVEPGEFPGPIDGGMGSTVVLGVNPSNSWVACTVFDPADSSLNNLKKGQSITVTCSFNGASGAPGIFAHVNLVRCKLQ